jgi:hypothetical protein
MSKPNNETATPPASFTSLVLMLAAGGFHALGLATDPTGKRSEVDLKMAQHTIDILEVLHQKTQGNLSAEETKLLDEILHELRLSYMKVKSQKEGGGR